MFKNQKYTVTNPLKKGKSHKIKDKWQNVFRVTIYTWKATFHITDSDLNKV